MIGSEKRGEGAGGSLLSLGRALRGEDPLEPDQPDAAARHRVARSRREARPSPLMVALAEDAKPSDAPAPAPATAAPVPPVEEAAAEDREAPGGSAEAELSWRASDFVRRWLPGEPGAAEAPVAEQPRGATPARPVIEQPAPVRASDLRPLGHAPVGRQHVPLYPQPEPTTAGGSVYWRPLIDPMKVISGVFNSKLIILGTTLLGALLGVAIALSTPKKYEAFAELLIDPRDLKLQDRELTQTGLPSDATLAIIENQVRVLTSGTVLTKVVDKLNLTADPEFNGNGDGGMIGLGELIGFARALLSRGGGSVEEPWRERALAVQNLGESLRVERGGKTFVVSIGSVTEDPEKSALIANTLISVFFETYGEFQSRTAGRAADELNSRLDELRAAVEDAERKVQAFKAENDIVDAQGRLITDDEILRLNEQLAAARARTLDLSTRAQSARGVNLEGAIGGAIPEELTSSTMTELRAQYARLNQDVDRLAVRLGPRHPERLAAEAQLEGARAQIAGELRRIVEATQVELRRAVQLEQELAAKLAQAKVRQGDLDSEMVTLRELEREANAKRSVYESFLLRAREAGEAKAVNTANMSIISEAQPPLNPIGPSRAMIAITGMMLGFFSGIGIGAARGAYWSFRENADRRAAVANGPADGPDDPSGAVRAVPAATPQPTEARSADTVPASSPRVAEATAEDTHPVGGAEFGEVVAEDITPLQEGEKEQSVSAGFGSEEFELAPESVVAAEQAEDAMKAASHHEHLNPGAYHPQPAFLPYGYPMPPAYAAPGYYPMHPAGYPPMPWASQAAAPYPYHAYPGGHFAPVPAPHGYPMPQQMVDLVPAAPEQPDEAAMSLEDIRVTLREFRDALRDLAESRQRQQRTA